MSTDGACCPHPFDTHVLRALVTGTVRGVEHVPVSGDVLCPECDCTQLWSLDVPRDAVD